MGKGVSIHIGLNYEGSINRLLGAENSARAMARIALQMGYRRIHVLLGENATPSAITQAMKQSANTLESGDTLLLTFAGHGGWVETTDANEDGRDETWCVFGSNLKDNELVKLERLFKDGVHIILVSDSCYSGGMDRFLPNGLRIPWRKASEVRRPGVALLAACGEEWRASDGSPYMVFTRHLLKTWHQGRFRGTYVKFIRAIKESMLAAEDVTPPVLACRPNDPIRSQRPFAI